jgi:antirestriction protein ArdC
LAITPTRADKVRLAKQTLDEHVQALAEQMRQGKSENLIHFLEFCSQFHCYSFGNIMLAFSQCPHMTRLAGLRTWNRLGRHVRPGEHGIIILAPMTVRRRDEKQDHPTEETAEDDGEERTVMLFKPVYVFDISQTEGKELPSLIHAEGDVTHCYPVLQEAVRRSGITLDYAPIVPGCPGALGASYGGRIVVQAKLPPADGFRTLAHEFAHEILHKHSPQESKTIRETEADAAAYVVCRHFGVDCDTADYLLLYNSEPKILLDRLETVRQTAARIIEAVEGDSSSKEEEGG